MTRLENLSPLLRRMRPFISANPKNRRSVTAQQYIDYFKFTIVRNPWDRAYSAYRNIERDPRHRARYRIGSMPPLEDFLRIYSGIGMLRPQTYWIKDFDGSVALDFIGRFENIRADFSFVARRIGSPDLELPHLLDGGNIHYKDAFTVGAKELVATFYAEEIELFSYEF